MKTGEAILLKARSALSVSGRRCKKTPVLTILCLPLLLTSCARTETEFVPTQVVPIPPQLLVDCEVPYIPERMTYGDSLELNEKFLTVIENCNLDKAAIRKIEESRASQ
ncbi:Rz1-like lysis system protein LysC [Pantoea dispersa]